MQFSDAIDKTIGTVVTDSVSYKENTSSTLNYNTAIDSTKYLFVCYICANDRSRDQLLITRMVLCLAILFSDSDNGEDVSTKELFRRLIVIQMN